MKEAEDSHSFISSSLSALFSSSSISTVSRGGRKGNHGRTPAIGSGITESFPFVNATSTEVHLILPSYANIETLVSNNLSLSLLTMARMMISLTSITLN